MSASHVPDISLETKLISMSKTPISSQAAATPSNYEKWSAYDGETASTGLDQAKPEVDHRKSAQINLQLAKDFAQTAFTATTGTVRIGAGLLKEGINNNSIMTLLLSVPVMLAGAAIAAVAAPFAGAATLVVGGKSVFDAALHSAAAGFEKRPE